MDTRPSVECSMTEPTYGAFDYSDVDGISDLQSRIESASDTRDWKGILQDHLTFGNNKIADTVAIFNITSATDCPNAKTKENGESETGLCQVPWKECYAHKSEDRYDAPLEYRRRQTYLWDRLTAEEFADAFVEIIDNKIVYGNAENYSDFDLRFNQAGDARTREDIEKMERVARILNDFGIDTYTYSASYKLDWSETKHLTVNQSYDGAVYGDRLYSAIDENDDLPENSVWCPHDKQKAEGVDPDEAIKCGDCRLCINAEGPNVYIPL